MEIPGYGKKACIHVKSLVIDRGYIGGFDACTCPLCGAFDMGMCQIPTIPPMLPGRGGVGQHIDRCTAKKGY
jgi:hypothetical protein